MLDAVQSIFGKNAMSDNTYDIFYACFNQGIDCRYERAARVGNIITHNGSFALEVSAPVHFN